MLKYLKAFVNGLVLMMIFALLALGISVIALQFPSVQTYAVRKINHQVSKKLGYPISVERVNIKWFDVVSLEGVSVKDTNQTDMIDVGRMDVNLNISYIIENASREILLDEVNLYQPEIHLKIVPGGGALNMDGFINRIVELTSSGIERPEGAPEDNIPFKIGKSKVIDGTFKYDDPRQTRRTNSNVFDYSHFELNRINGEVNAFLALGDTIAFVAKNLKMVDKQTGLDVKELDTRFLFCQKKMEMKSLNAYIGQSHLRDDVTFFYDRAGDMGDFNRKVVMKGHLSDSHVDSRDLGLFSEYVQQLHEVWTVSGDFAGTVDDFMFSNADIHFGKSSRLLGDIGFKGLPTFDGAVMDINLSLSEVNPMDIVQYYPEWQGHEDLEKFGLTVLDGTFKGTVEDFAVEASASSELGKLGADLVFHISDAKNTTYEGSVKASDFEIGILLDKLPNVQKVNFEGSIQGKGLELKYASTHLDAKVSSLGYNQYNYKNIVLKGDIQNQYFNGFISAKDSNLVLNLEGEFDLAKPQNVFQVQGAIQKANLANLGFMADSVTLSTVLDINLTGNHFDDLLGTAKLYDTYLLTPEKDKNLVIDTLLLHSGMQGGMRTLQLESEFLMATMKGNFVPSQALKDLQRVIEEYKLYFFGNQTDRKLYYASHANVPQSERYQIDYEVEAKNLTQVLSFLQPELYISRSAKAEGYFRMNNTAIINLNAVADTVRYQKSAFLHSEVDLTTSKFTNRSEVLASILVTSQQQQMGMFVPSENLVLEGTWDDDHIDFNGGLNQVNSSNDANLAGEIRFLPDGMDINFRNSKLRLLDEEWVVPAQSLIEVAGKNITFTNMGLINGNQRLSVNGQISDNPSQKLTVDIKNFKLKTLNPVLNTKLAGILDAVANVRDIYNRFVLDAKMDVEGLGYADYEFGNLRGVGEWDQFSNQLLIDAQLMKNTKRIFNMTGAYKPRLASNNLNLKAVFNQTELKAIEPFSDGLISEVSGTAQGTVLIKGTLDAPILDGSLMVDKGRVKVEYLQSAFTFGDKVTFSESEISVNNMLLTDMDGNSATVRGGVFHDSFKYFTLGFNGDLRNFKILNTTARDNSIFYGTAYVTGQTSIYGPIDNLKIEATATSNKGTKIFIPLDGATEVATQDYIQFVSQIAVDHADSVKQELNAGRIAGGIKMDFNFNITPDASCEIILNGQTGDIIRAYGNGRLNLKIDTQGDFAMTGRYEIERGDYNFTLQNVINKKFVIKPGSQITWSGDPYGAQLNVTAGYTQMVSLAGVLPASSTSNTGNEALLRRYPVEVIIGLSEGLMSPQIRYSLAILDNASLSNYRGQIEAFQSKLRADEQQLSLQVSSLLVMNQLLPEASLAGQTANQNFLGNSISELVSNQISRWASQLNENLEVGVTGLSLDQNALNNLQLRFSYRFLNDRFRVTRDGRISSGITGANQYDATSLLGEWTLEYWLTPTGTIRAKAYNRNIQNALLLNNTLTTGGFSFQFTHSFNRFSPMPKPSLLIPYVIPADSVDKDSTTNHLLSRKWFTR